MGRKTYYVKSTPHSKDFGGRDPIDYGGKGTGGDPLEPIEIDEMQDVIKSIGANDEQVKKEKEAGTNTYAKDNQRAIKKLKA